jgi:transposase
VIAPNMSSVRRFSRRRVCRVFKKSVGWLPPSINDDRLAVRWRPSLADTAYDADHFRDGVSAQKAHAVIPSHPSRAKKLPLDKDICKERHLGECCFSRLKHFRRVATRYEKTARNFLAMVSVAAIAIWLR